MLHLFLDKKPWFRAKNRGYGTGLPIAWQGWVFMALHIALIAGLSMALRNQPVAMTVVVVLAALAPMPIYQARTEGGWKWRWGNRAAEKRDDKRRKNSRAVRPDRLSTVSAGRRRPAPCPHTA